VSDLFEFGRLSWRSARLSARTFSDPRDDTPQNQRAWLDLIAAGETGDVPGFSDALSRAQGIIHCFNSKGALQRGPLPKRVQSLLEKNERYWAWREKNRLFSNDKEVAATAAQLAWFAWPQLFAPMARHRFLNPARKWSTPLDGLVRDNGSLIDCIEAEGPTGGASPNPLADAFFAEAAHALLDLSGAQTEADATLRADGRCVYERSASAAQTWLASALSAPASREEADMAKNDYRASVRTIHSAALDIADARAKLEGWGEEQWSSWARRALLGASKRPSRLAATAEFFWQRFPDALLPLSLDDSVSVATLLGPDNAKVFTDERLSRWMAQAPGKGVRPAAPNYHAAWVPAEGYEHRGASDQQPWTWVEWALWFARPRAAQTALGNGSPLLPNLRETMAPERFKEPYGSAHAFVSAWPKKRADLLLAIEHAELLVEAREGKLAAASTAARPAMRI
jgi:hypothetical protein